MKNYFASRLFQNSVWLLILQAFNTVVPLLTLPYITRVLEPSGYGLFSIALNWVQYFQVLVEFGFGFLGARKVATYGNDQLQEVFSVIISARGILVVVAFALMNLICALYGVSATQFICMLLLFMMVIGTAIQSTWLFQGKQDMQFITVVNAVSRTLSVVLVFLLVRTRDHLYWYCFLYACTSLFSGIIGLYVVHKKYGIKVRPVSLSSIICTIKEGSSLFLSQAMTRVLSSFGITLLGVVSSSGIVGIYSAIYKIPAILSQFFTPISQAFYPNTSIEYLKSDRQGWKATRKYAAMVIPVFAALAMIIIVLRKWIVMIVFGADYAVYSDVIIPLCLWLITGITNNFLGIQALVASGHQEEYSQAFFVGAVSALVLNILMGNLWGLYGVAWATFLSELILTLVLIHSIKRVFKL